MALCRDCIIKDYNKAPEIGTPKHKGVCTGCEKTTEVINPRFYIGKVGTKDNQPELFGGGKLGINP